ESVVDADGAAAQRVAARPFGALLLVERLSEAGFGTSQRGDERTRKRGAVGRAGCELREGGGAGPQVGGPVRLALRNVHADARDHVAARGSLRAFAQDAG